MGGEVVEEMCKRNLGGKEKWKARKQATGDRLGRVCKEKGVKQSPRVAKYNVHGCDLLGVDWQGYGSSLQTTSILVYRCEALGGAD